MLIKIPVSIGELADKITILEIKKKKIADKKKLKKITNELIFLNDILKNEVKLDNLMKKEISSLKKINLKLWDIEDGKRNCEKNKNFGPMFIKLARNVYILNDKRAKIKFKINSLSGSDIIEVKSYDKY
ncbi:DUF6165 family protein [Pelagibacterales bacterium]|nr:DUF6165 family protein [Pelagibacterales bacterium]